jgi:hypothetical protein
MLDFIPGDIVVYDDHTHYIGYIDVRGVEEGWYRWPAAEGGWAQRKVCPAPGSEELYEYGADQAQLALKLSGVEL